MCSSTRREEQEAVGQLTTSGSNPTGIVRCASPRAEQSRSKDCILLNKFFACLVTKHRAECPQTSGCEAFSF